MSNLEKDPLELVCAPDGPQSPAVQVLTPREVPLGGPRAMNVRRTLPQRGRTTIGAWCFADHYGPDDVGATGGMVVPPHPHTGLQTVSWLFEGEIEHRDCTGSHEMVRPGEVNLMTAGRGISHSEVSTPPPRRCTACSSGSRCPTPRATCGPFFEHAETTPVTIDDATVRVFVGSLPGDGHDPDHRRRRSSRRSSAPRSSCPPAARRGSTSTPRSSTACSSTPARRVAIAALDDEPDDGTAADLVAYARHARGASSDLPIGTRASPPATDARCGCCSSAASRSARRS